MTFYAKSEPCKIVISELKEDKNGKPYRMIFTANDKRVERYNLFCSQENFKFLPKDLKNDVSTDFGDDYYLVLFNLRDGKNGMKYINFGGLEKV